MADSSIPLSSPAAEPSPSSVVQFQVRVSSSSAISSDALLSLIRSAIQRELISQPLASPYHHSHLDVSLSLPAIPSTSDSLPTAGSAPTPSSVYYYLYFLSCLVTILFSAILLLAPHAGESMFYLILYFDPAGPADHSASCRSYTRLLSGILGAVMIGWMFTLLTILYYFILSNTQHRQSGLSTKTRYSILWFALSAPLVDWFLFDSAFSMATFYWQNVILNTAFIGAFSLPIWGLSPGRDGIKAIWSQLKSDWGIWKNSPPQNSIHRL